MADGVTFSSGRFLGNPLEGLQWGWRRRLDRVLQTEAAECGLACLVMISRYHGHDVDLPGLRRRFSTSLKGANLARVMNMANELGFSTRPLRLDLDELGQLKVPCILHWDLNHFVVLKRAGPRHIIIHDPARGERKLSLTQASDHFTGVALELVPAADFKPVEARQKISLRSLTGSVRGLVPAMAQVLVLALVLEVFALVGPFYMQWVLDQALVSADRSLLTLLGLGFLVVIVFQTLISAAQSWVVTWFGASLNVQWINNVFGHLLRLPLSWFETRHIGDVVSRFGSIRAIQATMTTQFIGSLLDGLMSVITLVVLCFYSLPLTALVVAAFALYALLRWVFFRPLYRAKEDRIVYAARQQSELLESIRGALPIKLANKHSERQARYANATVETVNRSIAIQRLSITFGVLNKLIFGLSRVALIWMAALMVLDGRFTVGMLVAFTAYASQFHGRAAGLIDKFIEFRMLRLHAERLADIALTEPEPCGQAAVRTRVPDASIEARNLSFRYAAGEPWVLRYCSFRIEPGESVAIVGPSGCGKTTLAKLLLGLLQPTEGEIRFGDIDIRKLGPLAYRNMIGAVMQEDRLFAGSIADNIAFFDAQASQARVEQAACLAAIHHDIASMPMGYQSLVGDMGSSLSGGQKQRVILARALYRRPRLLVLDEATSHLDMKHEARVNAAIKLLNLTRIVIAHRPETVASANRTLVLEAGQAQFLGPHTAAPEEAEVGTAHFPIYFKE